MNSRNATDLGRCLRSCQIWARIVEGLMNLREVNASGHGRSAVYLSLRVTTPYLLQFTSPRSRASGHMVRAVVFVPQT